MSLVPVPQSLLGFGGGLLTSLTAYSILKEGLKTDMHGLENNVKRIRRTIEYGLPLFIRDEEFLQVMNALEVRSRRYRREKTMWQKLVQAGQWNWNAGLAGAVGQFHEWSSPPRS